MGKGKARLLESIRFIRTETVSISQIEFDSKNPNIMSKAQQEGLNLVVKKYGFAVEPWLNDLGNGKYLCIDGEWRLKELIANDVKKLDAKIFKVPYKDVQILRQVANKLHGEHDSKKDAHEFLDIKNANNLKEFSDFLGKPIAEFEKMIEKELHEMENLKPIDEVDTETQCPKCGYEW